MNKNLPDWLQGAEELPPPEKRSMWYISTKNRIIVGFLGLFFLLFYFGAMFVLLPYEYASQMAWTSLTRMVLPVLATIVVVSILKRLIK